jgi:hypothetical protein
VANGISPAYQIFFILISIGVIVTGFVLLDLPRIKRSKRLMSPEVLTDTYREVSLIELILIVASGLAHNQSLGLVFPVSFFSCSLARSYTLKLFIDIAQESEEKLKSKEYIYLGTSICDGGESINNKKSKFDEPFFIKDDATRTMHTGLFGATGVGKTSSVIIPLVRHDILTGKHTVIIDPKNDGGACKQNIPSLLRCWKKMVYINFSRPELSDPYNPLAYGSPNMVQR